MISVSTGHRRLSPEEVPAIAAELAAAWQDPSIPLRQWISVVRSEVQRYREGERYRHFDVLVDMLKRTGLINPTLLDVGASSGFYREILSIGGFPSEYTALDYSPAYAKLARELFPDIRFQIGDATALPFADGEFDVVLSGCVIIHVLDYQSVISESARVARDFVVMNRTPIVLEGETEYYEKQAYGVRCFEARYAESELLDAFAMNGLSVVSFEDSYSDPKSNYCHRTYLLSRK